MQMVKWYLCFRHWQNGGEWNHIREYADFDN